MCDNHTKLNNYVLHNDYNNFKYKDTNTDNDSMETFRTESTESLSDSERIIHPDIHNYITELRQHVNEIEQIKKTLELNSDSISKLEIKKIEHEKKIQKLEYECENKINKLINRNNVNKKIHGNRIIYGKI